jgi:hypothetical protein
MNDVVCVTAQQPNLGEFSAVEFSAVEFAAHTAHHYPSEGGRFMGVPHPCGSVVLISKCWAAGPVLLH